MGFSPSHGENYRKKGASVAVVLRNCHISDRLKTLSIFAHTPQEIHSSRRLYKKFEVRAYAATRRRKLTDVVVDMRRDTGARAAPGDLSESKWSPSPMEIRNPRRVAGLLQGNRVFNGGGIVMMMWFCFLCSARECGASGDSDKASKETGSGERERQGRLFERREALSRDAEETWSESYRRTARRKRD
ncbi:hypothetical protein EVAR_16976_1 [Eumeta japonica]|uniref:Uncharacterized protein n=1 Tax=Eumeta variegata TaxID=151549 RepID=A0A4C1TVK6_EUMVA|nr:hypothetical protein EVAR_16976_1 [Eumeta japonica]